MTFKRFLGRLVPLFTITLWVHNESKSWQVWLPLALLSCASLDLYSFIYAETRKP